MIPNTPLSDRLADALVASAEAKAEAFRTERRYKAVLRACTLAAEARSWGERETRGAANPSAIEAEQAWIEAEMAATVAKAKADALQYRFEEWRTEAATDRARMALR